MFSNVDILFYCPKGFIFRDVLYSVGIPKQEARWSGGRAGTPQGIIETDLYIKPTDRNQFLLPTSSETMY